jgi:hypothetical protein
VIAPVVHFWLADRTAETGVLRRRLAGSLMREREFSARLGVHLSYRTA